MHNVGISMPHDSDPSFYRDHYEREVKKRDSSVLKNKLQGTRVASAIDGRYASPGSDMKEEKKTLNKKQLNMQSGFTSALTHADTVPSKYTSKPQFMSQSQEGLATMQ